MPPSISIGLKNLARRRKSSIQNGDRNQFNGFDQKSISISLAQRNLSEMISRLQPFSTQNQPDRSEGINIHKVVVDSDSEDLPFFTAFEEEYESDLDHQSGFEEDLEILKAEVLKVHATNEDLQRKLVEMKVKCKSQVERRVFAESLLSDLMRVLDMHQVLYRSKIGRIRRAYDDRYPKGERPG